MVAVVDGSVDTVVAFVVVGFVVKVGKVVAEVIFDVNIKLVVDCDGVESGMVFVKSDVKELGGTIEVVVKSVAIEDISVVLIVDDVAVVGFVN